MIALLALLLAAEAADAPVKPAPASAVTIAQLPPVAGASQYGAPASLQTRLGRATYFPRG